MKKTLDNENTKQAKASSTDVKVTGTPDAWELICKASSKEQGWMKSTKAMQTTQGVVLQVTTQQGEHVAEALVYIPDAEIVIDKESGFKYVT